MTVAKIAFAAIFLNDVGAQQAGKQKKEDHLPMSVSECTANGCTKQSKSVVLDANWRWTHKVNDYKNCYTGTEWNKTYCPSPQACSKNCAVDGVPTSDWETIYGAKSDGTNLNLGYKTGNNVGSRTYLLDDDQNYKMFKLLNREFTFDVDVSKLPCGINGALYFVEMQADGGKSEYAGNNAGAGFGTGYCDAQCPHDIKFISGEANILDWNNSTAMGKYGSCCAEFDIWEANAEATAYTAHPCTSEGPKRCENEKDCGEDGVCDKPGCDLNTYRFGNKEFFGKGSSFAIDTTKPVTVVTQFITSDNTDTGDLVEIRRKYVQDGKVIETPKVAASGKQFDSITDDFCASQHKEFGDKDQTTPRGGLKKMGEALGRGMVLVMSIWDDGAAHMLWLDSVYPVGKTGPGATRGPCDPSSGEPSATREKYPDSLVEFSNIKFGAIGSTTSGSGPSPGPAPTPSGCPGGSLSACMQLCPTDPTAFMACVKVCQSRCTSSVIV